MKILKMILIVMAVLVLLSCAGLYVFLKTVDLNAYMPTVIAEVQKATGRNLSIGKAALDISFSKGVVLNLSEVTLSDDAGFSKEAFLVVERFSMGVDIKALLFGGKIQVADITVKSPRVVIIRNKEGRINAAAIGAPAAPAGSEPVGSTGQENRPEGGTVPQAAALPSLLVKTINVTNAEITYIDEMFSPKLQIKVNRADAVVSDFSLAGTFGYTLKAALFSSEQDVEVSGRGKLDMTSQALTVDDLKVSADLAKVSAARLNTELPMAAPAGLKELKGKFEFLISSATFSAKGIESMSAQGKLAGGYLLSTLAPLPVEGVELVFTADARDIDITSLQAVISGGKLTGTAGVKQYMVVPQMTASIVLDGLETSKVSEAYKFPVTVSGKLAARAELGCTGKTPEEITSSLKADISASLKNGEIKGMNLLQLGLGNIPMFPDLLTTVQESLPAETQEEIKKGITVIQKAEAEARMDGMHVSLNRAEVVTRDMASSVKGTMDIPQSLDLKAAILIQPALSTALVSKIGDLEGLKNDEGKIYIPLFVTGAMVKPQVQPDVTYLSKKLLASRGTKELERVISKNPEVQGVLNALFGKPKETSGTQGGESGAAAKSTESAGESSSENVSAGEAVDSLLNSFFKKK